MLKSKHLIGHFFGFIFFVTITATSAVGVYALAGFAEHVTEHTYGKYFLRVGSPSDMCPSEFGNQHCMWVYSLGDVYLGSLPLFVQISDPTEHYVAGQSYKDKSWILYNTDEGKVVSTYETREDLEKEMNRLGISATLYTLSEAKKHFSKTADTIKSERSEMWFALLFFVVPFLIILVIFIVVIRLIIKLFKYIRSKTHTDSSSSFEIASVHSAGNLGVPAPTSIPNTSDSTNSQSVPAVSNTSLTLSEVPISTLLVTDTITATGNEKSAIKTMLAVVFIVLALSYTAITLLSTVTLSDLGLSRASAPTGKTVLRMVVNKEIVKDVKSLTVLHEKEGLLKDNLAVYRCNVVGKKYDVCVVQDIVKHPESFQRVTAIFGKDSESAYVIDEKTNNYKVLVGASAPTFRSLYNVSTEGVAGLYAGDDLKLFKGEKVLTIKSVPAGMNDSLFYKQYREGEPDAQGRQPYSRMTGGWDGEIQYMGDNEFIYHGNGKASSTDPFVHLTKVEGLDFSTFKYYEQKMIGTSYLKYAYDKNNIYCDNVNLGTDGYFSSDGLTILKDANPSSFKVIYPTSAITEKNASIQVAKTDTQVFVNCAPQSNIDAATLKVDRALGSDTVFSDKNNEYKVEAVTASGTQSFILRK